MRISAIYIDKHEYLFDKPQTINLGGEYFYEFTKDADSIIVERSINPNFINGLFDLTNLKSKITNVNAIVGQNGSGKSSLLDLIRSEFIENEYALPQSSSLFLVEAEDMSKPIILRNDFRSVYFKEFVKGETKLVELKDPIPKKAQTIYYSPHYDYKFNPNFDNVDNHDISFDKILQEDLSEMAAKDTNDSGWDYSASQELLFKNSLRQIEFLSSDLVDKQNIFKDIFQLQKHYEPMLTFRGYKDNEREWNTPTAFRRILKLIVEKLDNETNEWHTIRKFKGDKVLNQLEIEQYILKRNVIKSIISLLYKQMERKNSFLEEGVFPYDKLKVQLQELNAYDSFLLFVENASLAIKTGKSDKVFDAEDFKKLLAKIYEAIEDADSEDLVSNTTLKTSRESAIEILKLQRNFINKLNRYYYVFNPAKEKSIVSDYERIEEFIHYMPFSRRLSSGENALLNLFSRIYGFLNSNLKENRFRELKEHYILLLDEADLSFHPSWKKKFVNALLKTLPYFFQELETRPSLQVIFTTHDPLTLSDLPNSNVVYIERRTYDEKPNVLNYKSNNRPYKTFGANISDLLADSFFVDNSLIGDFSYNLIQNTITWLNQKENHENSEYYRKIIQIIDEPIIQRKLAEMYDDKSPEKFQLKIIEEQIKKLENLKNKLEE